MLPSSSKAALDFSPPPQYTYPSRETGPHQRIMDYTQLKDEILLHLIASSQENALSELYDRYSRLIYSVALNTLSDPGRAEEVTQDVFVRVWEKAKTYSAEHGRVVTWLTRIARHRSIDLYP